MLAFDDRSSITAMSRFGAPIHCAVDRSTNSLTGNLTDLTSFGVVVKSTVEVLVNNGADVNQSFVRYGEQLIGKALLNLDGGACTIFLRAGLLCDRRTLQKLFEQEIEMINSPGDAKPAKDSTFDQLTTRNVLATDQEHWIRLKHSLSQKRETGSSLSSNMRVANHLTTGSERDLPDMLPSAGNSSAKKHFISESLLSARLLCMHALVA